MVQVLTTNKEQASKVEKKIINVTKNLQKYFIQVNHALFKDHNTDDADSSKISIQYKMMILAWIS